MTQSAVEQVQKPKFAGAVSCLIVRIAVLKAGTMSTLDNSV
jgi:hypothetical protein